MSELNKTETRTLGDENKHQFEQALKDPYGFGEQQKETVKFSLEELETAAGQAGPSALKLAKVELPAA